MSEETDRMPERLRMTRPLARESGEERGASITRWSWVVAWAFGILAVVMYTAWAAMTWEDAGGGWETAGRIAEGAVFLVPATVGGFIVSRHSRNVIGWLFVLITPQLVGDTLFEVWLPANAADVSITQTILLTLWNPTGLPLIFGMLTLLFLLFPDNRPPSKRWRPLLWLVIGLLAGAFIDSAFGDPFAVGNPEEGPPVPNPLHVPAFEAVTGALILPWLALMLLAIACCIVSLVVRFRHSRGVERQQIKWVLYVGAVVATAFLITLPMPSHIAQTTFVQFFVIVFGFIGALVGLPVAIGIAILRHGLYRIDVIINRTLVYSALSAALAALYAGSVVTLQALLKPLTSGGNLAIAASTLMVAALFQPIRRRVQHIVDLRFYRSKYDAERTVALFAARLREDVDLDSLAGELRAVVHETVQPAHISLWLRSPVSPDRSRP